MREGKVVTLVPRTQRLTTQEAADFLGVSRPTMVKLLEDGKIPYEQPGRHRRIMFTDLLAYTERQHADRRAALDRMTEDASEAAIYGDTPGDYAAAPKRARRRAARQEDVGPMRDQLPGGPLLFRLGSTPKARLSRRIDVGPVRGGRGWCRAGVRRPDTISAGLSQHSRLATTRAQGSPVGTGCPPGRRTR